MVEYDDLIELIDITLKAQEMLKDPVKTKAWLTMDNLNFGGSSPIRLIILDRGHKVLQFIEDVQEGNLP